MAEGGPKARRLRESRRADSSATRRSSGASTGGSASAPPRRSCSASPRIVIAYESLKRPADVHNPDAVFKPEKPKKQIRKTVAWPLYGYDRARTRYLPAKGIKPPFKDVWRYTGQPLLEFPPVVAAGRLFFVNNSGYAVSLDADTGKQLWKRRIGAPQRLDARLLPPPPLHRQPGPRAHRQARREDRQDDLEKSLPGRAESSPLVIDRTRLLRLRRRQPLRAQHPQRQRALVDPNWGARSSRRPPTTAAPSTSATTAAT